MNKTARDRGGLSAGRNIFHALALPYLVYLSVTFVFSLAAARHDFAFSDPSIWARWDSGHYLTIASEGYEIIFCGPEGTEAFYQRCGGNTGWFPAYPLLIRLVSSLGVSPVAAGVWISNVFCYIALVLVWTLFLGAEYSWTHLAVLTCAAFFSGHVYDHAVFPLSMVAVFSLLFIYGAKRGQWLKAGAAGAWLVFSYPLAFLLPLSAGLWNLFYVRRIPFKETAKRFLGLCAMPVLGLAGVFFVQFLDTGFWDAFFKWFKVAGTYGVVRAEVPFIFKMLEHLMDPAHWHDITIVPFLQTPVTIALVVSVTTAAFVRRKEWAPYEFLILIFAWLGLLFPYLLAGYPSLYRHEAILIPVILLLRRSGRFLPWLFAFLFLGLSYPMARLFFLGVLV